MSIPNEFRPVKGAVTELPYVQPVMTGYSTWSNEPSFGATVTGIVSHGINPAWKSMDSDSNSCTTFSSTTDVSNPDKGIIITLEKPVRLEKLTIHCKFETPDELYFFGGDADSEDELIRRAERKGTRTLEILVPNQKMYKRFRLYSVNPDVAYTWIFDIKLTAYYKP